MNYSIKKFFNILGVTWFIMILLAFFVVYKLSDSSFKYAKVAKDKIEMLKYADLLRQSSDDLTKYARLYVVTSNEDYKDVYHNILDIRNGYNKRPQNYQNIYWDLLEPLRSEKHPLGKKKALHELLKKLPYDEFEYKMLENARTNSNELVGIEVEAFNAMVGLYKDENSNYSVYGEKDQNKAIELLHSPEYLKEKEKIMLPLDEMISHLDKRTSISIQELRADIIFYTNILIFIGAVATVLFIAIFYIIIKKILVPIIYLSDEIYNFKNNRTVRAVKKVFYNDEIGYMSKQFYKMRDNINSDIEVLSKSERKIKEYLQLVDKNIITSSTDLAGRITYVSEAFCEISGFSKEELIGNTHSMVKHTDMSSTVYDDLWDTIIKDKTWRGEIKNRAKDGSFYWVDATVYPIYDENGEKIGYTAIRVDITDKKRVEILLENSKLNEKKIQNYVNLVDKNIITSSTNLAGKITYVSEAFCEISGFSKDELIGENHSIVRHTDMPSDIYDELWDTITNNRTWNGEIKNRTKNGGFYWVDATIYPTFDFSGEKVGYTAIRIDITNKKKVEELLVTDGLTGIYNRRFFNESISRAINTAKRDRKYFSFLMIDIDHFKQYNDTYGHQEGDRVLIEVAKTLKSSLNRSSDMCFRLGGEEFGIVFQSLDKDEAYKFANKIRKNIENLKIIHEKNSASKYITASMGLITKKDLTGITDDDVYKEADSYLYKAKELGRNRVEANDI